MLQELGKELNAIYFGSAAALSAVLIAVGCGAATLKRQGQEKNAALKWLFVIRVFEQQKTALGIIYSYPQKRIWRLSGLLSDTAPNQYS